MEQTTLASEHFFRGLKALNAGDLAMAEAQFLDALRLAPGRPSVLVNLSVVYARQDRLAEALKLAEEAVRQDASDPMFWLQKGAVQLRLERFEDALLSLDTALAMNPGLPELHNNRGTALNALGRFEEALASYDKAIALKPDHAEAYSNRGVVLKDLGRLDDALASADRAISLKPRSAEAHGGRANILKDMKRHEDALAGYDTAIGLKPDYAEAYSNRGIALRALNRPLDALASCDKAIKLKPAYAEAHGNRGNALQDLERLEEALASYDQAIRLKPDHAEIINNRGNVLTELGRLQEALACFEKAIGLQPDLAETYSNRGNALKALNLLDDALANFDEALRLKPDLPSARYNKSFIVLQRDNLVEGFELQLSRWDTSEFTWKRPTTSIPAWSGAPFSGELLLWGEQGIGDEVFHASMLSLLDPGKIAITVSADVRLHPAYERSFPGIKLLDRNLTRNTVEGPFDFQAPVGDLGYLLKVDRETLARRRYPYLKSCPSRRSRLLADSPFLQKSPVCGVSWRSGNSKNGQNRSVQLHEFLGQLKGSEITFVSLQYGDVASDVENARRQAGIDVEVLPGLDTFHDIDGLLALIDLCDIVYTIDNATAHFAGALGKTSVVIVPSGKGRYWYWGEEGQSTWYPSVSIVQQQKTGHWTSALARASGEVGTFCRDRLAGPRSKP